MSPYKIPPKINEEMIQGVKIIGGDPHMKTEDEGLRYVYVEDDEEMYFNTETGEVRIVRKHEVP